MENSGLLIAREEQILGNARRDSAVLVEDDHAKQQILQWFNTWDLNSDGVISKPELQRVLQAVKMDPTHIDDIMRHADRNGDGKIQYSEFINWIWQAPAQIAAPVYCQTGETEHAVVDFMDFVAELISEKNQFGKLRKIFDSLDLNNNGKISMSEFVSGVRSLGYSNVMCTEVMLKQIFETVDQEMKVRGKMQKDRVLSFAEFTKAFKESAYAFQPEAGA